jgi:hypothetical protein
MIKLWTVALCVGMLIGCAPETQEPPPDPGPKAELCGDAAKTKTCQVWVPESDAYCFPDGETGPAPFGGNIPAAGCGAMSADAPAYKPEYGAPAAVQGEPREYDWWCCVPSAE